MRRSVAVGLLWCLCVVPSAHPADRASAQVVDPDGKPIEGATACLVTAGVQQLCGSTNSDGTYVLPGSEVTSVRILARGFLPRTVAAVRQEGPVVLERAASLRVRLIDKSSGKGAVKGKVFLVYSTGRRLGPFPTNAAGVSLKTLPPGNIHPVGQAEGYREATGPSLALVAGQEQEVVVEIERETEAGKR